MPAPPAVSASPASPDLPDQPLSPPASPARRNRREFTGLLGVLVLLALLLAALRWAEHAEIDAAERSRLAAQAYAAEQNLARQLLGINDALRGVRDALPTWPAAERAPFVTRRLSALCAAMPGVRSMHWLNAEGRVVASNLSAAVGTQVADRAYFAAMRERPDADTLYVSEPFRSRVAAVFTLNLSVVMLTADGRFDGAVIASLDPQYFDTVLGATLYAPDMQAALLHPGGVALLQVPQQAHADDAAALGPGLQRHLQRGQPGSVETVGIDGDAAPRMVAWRTLHPQGLPMDQPLVLRLSRSSAAVFAGWRRQTLIEGLAFAIVAAAAFWALQALQRRRRQLEELAFHSEARHVADLERVALVLRGGDLALWDAHIPSGAGVVNERWYSMLGYARDQITADESSWRALLHPDDAERVLAAQQAHLDGRTETYEAVYRLRHRDGHWVWVLDRGRVVERDAEGKPLHMVGTHLDISERVLAEEALRRSEEKLAITLHSIGDAVIATDRQGTVTRMNATAARLTGWSVDEALGQPLHEVFRIFRGSTREAAQDPVSQVLALDRTVDLANDTVLRARDGSEFQIADSAAPIRDTAGSVVGVVLVFSDVTERYRTMHSLRQAEARLRMASRMARLGSWHLHRDGGPILSPEAAELVELAPGQALRREQGYQLVDPAFREPLRQALRRCVREGLPFDIEIEGHTQRGKPLRVRVLGEAQRDAHERIVAIQGAMQDLTEPHRAQQQLRQLQDERLVLERRLHDAQRMESIGTLAGGIAHDFNNILPAILGNVALARQDLQPVLPLQHPVWGCLEQIQRAGLRARSLVQQILTFSRREVRALQPQSIRPVVDETLSLLHATLPGSVRVMTTLSDEPLVVEGEATQLQQVLMNLCTNAWHALPDGRGTIEVGLERVPSVHGVAGPCAHLWVRDDGSGMDDVTQQRAFDPFFTTKPVGQGTGLGLSVVHGIVHGHHGHIVLDSRLGRGTTFHVYLPLRDSAVPLPAPPADAPSPAAGAGQRVLYVDDDEVMVLLVQRLLQRDGYDVVTAASAAQALEQLRRLPVDLLVSDYNMPERSGLDLALQARAAWPSLPIVITTGNVTAELRQRALGAGVNGLLRKENTLEELPALVQRVLAGEAPGAAS